MKRLYNYLKFIVHVLMLVIIGLFLCYCSHLVDNSKKKTDPAFRKYISKFEKDTGAKIRYPVYFEKTKGKVIGTCYMVGSTPLYVIIKKEFWNRASERERNLLIFHELGHCSFDLDHNDEEYDNGCPKYLMNSSFPPKRCIRYYYHDYMKKFLTNIRKKESHDQMCSDLSFILNPDDRICGSN